MSKSRPELLRLYRHTLHAAANFPSIKKAGMRVCFLRSLTSLYAKQLSRSQA